MTWWWQLCTCCNFFFKWWKWLRLSSRPTWWGEWGGDDRTIMVLVGWRHSNAETTRILWNNLSATDSCWKYKRNGIYQCLLRHGQEKKNWSCTGRETFNKSRKFVSRLGVMNGWMNRYVVLMKGFISVKAWINSFPTLAYWGQYSGTRGIAVML